MARYIDADKLIADGWVLERHGTSNKLLQVMSIADVPTADVVEVVRCKDCKHFRPYDHGDFGECRKLGEFPDRPEMYEHDFCSYGERWNERGD